MYNFSRANLEQKKLISKYKLVNQNCNIHLSCKFISCSSIAGITVMDGYMDIFHIWYKQISNCMNKEKISSSTDSSSIEQRNKHQSFVYRIGLSVI